MKSYTLGTVIFAVISGGWILSCDLEDAKDDSAGTTSSGSCFVTASVTDIAKGDSVTLTAAKNVSWDDYSSISVAGQTLSSANPDGVTVTPDTSRVYSAVGKMTDGSTESCDIEITVDGAELSLGCTLVADPPSVSGVQSVNVTLQVTGTGEVSSTSINSVDLEAEAGGSKAFTVVNDMSFVGNVLAADGGEANCSIDVTFETKVADGECTKVEPSPADHKELEALQATLDEANAKALADKQAETLPENATELTFQREEKAGYFNATSICKVISGQDDATLCTIELNASTQPNFAQVVYDGKNYEVYAGQFEQVDIRVVALAGGNPMPIFLRQQAVSAKTLEVEVCECTFSPGAGSEGLVAGDIASPAADYIWYEVDAGIRTDDYTSATYLSYEFQRAYIQQTKISPPAGTPKPECPIDWNVAT